MQHLVTGHELWQWRNIAVADAIANDVDVYEVDWLLIELANLDRLALRLEWYKDRPQIEMQLSLKDLDSLWQRRLYERLPVQYIVGATPWRNFKLHVSPAVLIPRPETECLIELALAATNVNKSLEYGDWVDLGTGSGAIALGLTDIFPDAKIHAVDFSADALAIAAINARDLGLSERIKFYQGRWWEPLTYLKGQFSGMVSNPPYIPSDTVTNLQPEIVNHEPHLALDGGNDGLDCIRQLIETSPAFLEPDGVWLIEMMAGQADTVRQLLQDNGNYRNIEIHADLAGIERFAMAFIQ